MTVVFAAYSREITGAVDHDRAAGWITVSAPLKVELAAPGSAYAVVSDGSRFLVLRATPALRVSAGKRVDVSRDPQGRMVLRAVPEKDLGRP